MIGAPNNSTRRTLQHQVGGISPEPKVASRNR
jgi:hypothetical protein